MNWLWLFAFAFFTGLIALLMRAATEIVSSEIVIFVALSAAIVLLIDSRR